VSAPGAVIAEDEPLIRGEIRDTLNSLWPELTILAQVDNGIQALAAIERLTPDILFLDIHMPGVNGLEVAQRLSGKVHVVFISAFDRYAIEAFEHGALDYVVKPVSQARMKVTVERLKTRLREPPADLSKIASLLKGIVTTEPEYLKWLTVPHGSELRVVATTEISYLRADRKYTTLATSYGTFLINSSLREMKEKLDPKMFWQIHRSVIVNVGAIDVIYRTFRGALEVKLKDRSELLPVSAPHAHLFTQTAR
jgi:DNA-binding LytR/AlgR family response regulator